MFGWGALEWAAVGQILLGFGAVTAGIWAVFNYRKNRRALAARWLQDVFRDFYLEDKFENIRHVMEYNFDSVMGPLLERRVTDRHISPTSTELGLLKELDDLLNYFEFVLYLEQQKHIKKVDRLALFEYWFEIMSAHERASIRRYSAFFGFERVTEALVTENIDHVALYGSLMSGLTGPDAPDVTGALKLIGPCLINGYLVDLNDYPGLVRSDDSSDVVKGELYRVNDKRAFKLLDKFERYDPSDSAGSLYIRRLVRLREPSVDAWVYIYNRSIEGRERIPGGDWRGYRGGQAPDIGTST